MKLELQFDSEERVENAAVDAAKERGQKGPGGKAYIEIPMRRNEMGWNWIC